MSLAPPKLDTRSFDDLLSEARQRIARYTPEYQIAWTDHNESDPGITLLQLFAWLAQVTMERVNMLPDRAYRSLLELVGIDVKPAVPAEADLVFEPIPGVSRAISVPKGSRVGAPPAADGAPVIFETLEALDVTGCELTHLLTYDGTAFKDLTEQNSDEGDSIYPFGRRPQVGAAIYFGFAVPQSRNAGWQPFPGRLALRVFEPMRTGAPPPVKVGAEPESAETRLEWEYYVPLEEAWQSLQIFEDGTEAFTQGGYLSLEGPPADIEPAPLRDVRDPHYWVRLRVDRSDYGTRIPEAAFFRFNSVRAQHQVTVENESLGVSDGSPNQQFHTAFRPVVPGTLRVEVEGDSGVRDPWTQVNYFRPTDPDDAQDVTAGPDAPVYTVHHQSGRISFGDGYRAVIPSAGRAVVAAQYQYGGGLAGNAEPEMIATLQETLPGVRGVQNPRRAFGGKETQSVEEALRLAPLQLLRRSRAVTVGDYESAAQEVGAVARAHVIPLAHPGYPELEVPGAVTVLVIQDTERMPPTPTGSLLKRVARELEKQRVLTAEVYVRSPEFTEIAIQADLLVDPEFAFGAAKIAALKRLNEFLSPMEWSFGRDVYPASIFHELLELRDEFGIRAVERLRLYVNGRHHLSETAPISISEGVMIYPGDHRLEMRLYREQ